MIRVFLTVIFFTSVLFMPWWFSIPLAVLLIAYYQAYVEVVVGAIIMDGMFGTPVSAFLGVEFFYTFIIVSLVILSVFMNRVMMG